MRQKIIVMIAVMSGLFLVALDQTIISTALGKIVEDFNSFSSLGWVVTAYLLTSTVTIPIAGKLSDIFGRRLILLIGVGLFTSASLLSGASQSIDQLILFRALQGIGGGIIMANAFTIVGDLFSPRERGKWQGLIGAVFGLSSIIGPLLGGFLTDSHMIAGLSTDWRWTFWINVPIGIVSFLIIARYCPSIKHEHKPKIDYLGAALLSLSLSSLILAVNNTERIFAGIIEAGFSATAVKLGLYIIAAITAALFVRVERRATEPIIPLSFFKNKNFTTFMVAALLFGAAFIGAIIYLTQFNLQVFSATATEAGLMLLPMIGGLSITAIITGQIVTRTGKYKALIVGGFALTTVAVFMLTTLNPASPYWYEAVLIALAGIGLGTGMPIMNLAVQNEFEQRDLGAATSSSQLFRGLGSTIGTAVLGTILTAGITTQLGDLNQNSYIQTLKQQPASSQILQTLDVDTALNLNTSDTKNKINASLAKSLESSQAPESTKQAIRTDFKAKQDDYSQKVVQSFSEAMRPLFYVSSGLMAVATLVILTIKERRLRGGADDTPGLE